MEDFDWLDLMRGITEFHVKFAGERAEAIVADNAIPKAMTSSAIQALPLDSVERKEEIPQVPTGVAAPTRYPLLERKP